MVNYIINLLRGSQNRRQEIELVHPDNGRSYILTECPAEHSVYHSVWSVENLISTLEKGVKLSVGGPDVHGICKGVPAAFFGGHPDGMYGALFVATHTYDFDRPMFLNEKSTNVRNDYIGDYGPVRSGRNHPCKVANRYEEKSLRRVLNQEEINHYRFSTAVMGSDSLEHVILGFQGKEEFVRSRDGFGVGILGRNIETDPFAEELARRNVPFKYVEHGIHGFVDSSFTYREFPRA